MEERFEFICNLGEGGYGTVWKCLDRETGNMVAMKRFKEAHLDEEVMLLALREIQLLKASRHPNIVHLYEAFKSHSGRVYLVMEHVHHSLTSELRRHPRGFTVPMLKMATWQILQATAFMHCNRIIHRDLKPANILVSDEGTIKLCDFGFARTITATDTADYTQYVVTRWYRPPELLVGGPYGTPVDIWAIGCLFCEMATGRPLFPGRDTMDQLWLTMEALGPLPSWQMQMLSSEATLTGFLSPSPSQLRSFHERFPDFSQEMMEVVEACLHPDPAMRLTALEVLALPFFDDVHTYTAGSAIQAEYDAAFSDFVMKGTSTSTAKCLWSCSTSSIKERANRNAALNTKTQASSFLTTPLTAAPPGGSQPVNGRFSVSKRLLIRSALKVQHIGPDSNTRRATISSLANEPVIASLQISDRLEAPASNLIRAQSFKEPSQGQGRACLGSSLKICSSRDFSQACDFSQANRLSKVSNQVVCNADDVRRASYSIIHPDPLQLLPMSRGSSGHVAFADDRQPERWTQEEKQPGISGVHLEGQLKRPSNGASGPRRRSSNFKLELTGSTVQQRTFLSTSNSSFSGHHLPKLKHIDKVQEISNQNLLAKRDSTSSLPDIP